MVRLGRRKFFTDEEWQRFSTLYETAFPEEERRTSGKLRKMAEIEDEMVFNEILCDDESAGFQIYWDFGEFCYLEHFAVFENMRGRGIGAAVLEELKAVLCKPLVLEVEPAAGGITARRVGFYERCGFKVLPVEYVQPCYETHGDAMPLWIMSTWTPLPAQADKWVDTIKQNVYYKWLGVGE